MAALVRHVFVGALTKRLPIISCTKTQLITLPSRSHTKGKFNVGPKQKKLCQKPKKKATIESIMASIEAKGFLRNYKPYLPPSDVSERIHAICELEGVSNDDAEIIEDMALRFKLFVKCAENFNYAIPNSKLCGIQTIGDLKIFYQTPVDTKTPLEKLKTMELPTNLHVQQDYVRFHPDSDKLFGGKTAFPQSATIVTGLQYKNKYPGHRPEKPWPQKVKSMFDD